MGYCPAWYACWKAAQALNTTPWELLGLEERGGVWWQDKILLGLTAEHQAEEAIRNRIK